MGGHTSAMPTIKGISPKPKRSEYFHSRLWGFLIPMSSQTQPGCSLHVSDFAMPRKASFSALEPRVVLTRIQSIIFKPIPTVFSTRYVTSDQCIAPRLYSGSSVCWPFFQNFTVCVLTQSVQDKYLDNLSKFLLLGSES